MNIGDYAKGTAFANKSKPEELIGNCAGVIIGIFQDGTVELQGQLFPDTPYVCRVQDVAVVPDNNLWSGTKEFVMQWRHNHRQEQVKQIIFLFEEKIKTSERNITNLQQHRDRAYASGHLVESYDRELARWQEKHYTLAALYQEVQAVLSKWTNCA